MRFPDCSASPGLRLPHPFRQARRGIRRILPSAARVRREPGPLRISTPRPARDLCLVLKRTESAGRFRADRFRSPDRQETDPTQALAMLHEPGFFPELEERSAKALPVRAPATKPIRIPDRARFPGPGAPTWARWAVRHWQSEEAQPPAAEEEAVAAGLQPLLAPVLPAQIPESLPPS